MVNGVVLGGKLPVYNACPLTILTFDIYPVIKLEGAAASAPIPRTTELYPNDELLVNTVPVDTPFTYKLIELPDLTHATCTHELLVGAGPVPISVPVVAFKLICHLFTTHRISNQLVLLFIPINDCGVPIAVLVKYIQPSIVKSPENTKEAFAAILKESVVPLKEVL